MNLKTFIFIITGFIFIIKITLILFIYLFIYLFVSIYKSNIDYIKFLL
jgi:hypothetical protein